MVQLAAVLNSAPLHGRVARTTIIIILIGVDQNFCEGCIASFHCIEKLQRLQSTEPPSIATDLQVLSEMSSSRLLRSFLSGAPVWAAREATSRSQALASVSSASLRASLGERSLGRRSLHVSQCICKSKRSFAKSVDDSGGWENEDGGADVPVMRTKGKGKPAKSAGSKGGAKSRRGDKEAEALENAYGFWSVPRH